MASIPGQVVVLNVVAAADCFCPFFTLVLAVAAAAESLRLSAKSTLDTGTNVVRLMGILTSSMEALAAAAAAAVPLTRPAAAPKAGPKMLWRVTEEMSGMVVRGWLRRTGFCLL